MAVRTAQVCFKIRRIERDIPGCAAFAANGGECSAEQTRRAPFGMMRLSRAGHSFRDALAPTTLRHEDFILRIVEMFVDQPVPVLEPHGVVLANAEALFLVRADNVAHD